MEWGLGRDYQSNHDCRALRRKAFPAKGRDTHSNVFSRLFGGSIVKNWQIPLNVYAVLYADNVIAAILQTCVVYRNNCQ